MTAEPTCRVGVVVVHWRGMADTRECLASLAQLDYLELDIVVVTNGPGDFDAVAAAAACPGARIIALPDNRGYAAGCNAGARAVLERGADVVLLLNNDTTVAPDLATHLLAVFDAEPRAGIAGPVVTYYDDPTLVWSAGGTLQRTLGYTRHNRFRSRSVQATNQACDYISGSAIAIRRAVLERVGDLDERYFHYFEDVDICERARAAGYHSVTVASASVRHKVSAAAGERGSNRLNDAQAYYFTRNRWHFLHRNVQGVQRWIALASQLVVLFPYEMAKAGAARNWPELRGRTAGIVDAVRGRDGPRGATS